MKITGGSFGLSGGVRVDYTKGTVSISAGTFKLYEKESIEGIDLDQSAESKIGCLSVIFGLLIITPILTLLFNIFGLIAGVILTVVGSKYTVKKNTATIRFKDGKQVKVQGAWSEINRLSKLNTL